MKLALAPSSQVRRKPAAAPTRASMRIIASVQTGHYFASPFALLFTVGYAYVAVLLVREQAARRREAPRAATLATSPALALVDGAEGGTISEPPPPASGEQYTLAGAQPRSAASSSEMAA